MSILDNIKMKPKLIGLFLIIGLVPLITISVFSIVRAQEALTQQAYNELEAIHETLRAEMTRYFAERQSDMGVLVETVSTHRQGTFDKLESMLADRRNELERYFQALAGEVRFLKDDPTTAEAIQAFQTASEAEGERVNGPQWRATEEKFGPVFHDVVEDFGYYDAFLITADGHIAYTVRKESDLGKDISDNTLKESGLAEVFQTAMGNEDEIAFADFDKYAPSGDEPAAFVAGAVRNITGTLVGVVAIQVPTDEINAIMQERAGMGETGECYLVGPDKLMRSDSYLDPDNHSIAASFDNPEGGQVDTTATRGALAGLAGKDVIVDYRGKHVLSIYEPVDIFGVRWAAICEIDVTEAFVPRDEAGEQFYAKYIQEYGYHDLFLVNPDGYVYYTVRRENDYQTNLVNGPYSDSNLGRLIQEVVQTQKFGFADFKPYEPSDGAPAAFIAQPLINSGEVEVVVALQLPVEGINAITRVEKGMGETGEAYLVGPDKRMRSDSYLDPAGHSIKASFAGTIEENGVDTEAVRRALAGTDAKDVIVDYNGNRVLSAYGPVDIFGTTWALLAEINEAEINAPSNMLRNILLLIGGIVAAIVTLVGLYVATNLANPILMIAEGAQRLSRGDAELAEMDWDAFERIKARKDELGVTGRAFAALIDYFKEMTSVAQHIADGDLTARVRPKGATDLLGNAFAEMIADLRALIGQVADSANSVGAASGQLSASADQSAQATNQVATTIQQVAQGTAQQTEKVSSATSTTEQVARAIDGVSRGAQEQAAAVGKAAEITASINATARQTVATAQTGTKGGAEAAQTAREGAETIRKAVQGIEGIKASVDLVRGRPRR